MMEKRNGENGVWRLMRLVPIIILIASVIGWSYVIGDDLGEVEASTSRLWEKYGETRTSIFELETQTAVIEFHLKQVDKKLEEQGSDIKDILTEVRK